jgi:MtN3 and saliva related transmembrane protein
MNYIDILGLVGGGFTTCSMIPQLIQIIKTKSTKDISLGMFLMTVTGLAFWLCYGILTKALPIMISNSLSLIMSITIVFYKFKYK